MLDTRRTPKYMECICNIVFSVKRRDIVGMTDIVGIGGVIGSGSSCSNACASVGSRVSQEGARINKHRKYEFCSHFSRECGSRSNNKSKSHQQEKRNSKEQVAILYVFIYVRDIPHYTTNVYIYIYVDMYM